jgi:hypothetical protein
MLYGEAVDDIVANVGTYFYIAKTSRGYRLLKLLLMSNSIKGTSGIANALPRLWRAVLAQ